jgi:DNA-binding response OmpR family regulator
MDAQTAAKILVIDDDDKMNELVALTLRNQGFQVDTADNGERGLKLMKATPYDLVITDVLMPEKEGFQTIREIRAISQVKIIAISGAHHLGGMDLLAISKMLGASASLRKPFDGTSLIELVRELLAAD